MGQRCLRDELQPAGRIALGVLCAHPQEDAGGTWGLNRCATISVMAVQPAHEHENAGRRALTAALILIGGLLIAELAVGIVAGSLALLADAGHMLTDVAALALALVAAAIAQRPPGGSWTFGFRRVEILAALANGITLALVGLWIVFEAVRRLVSPTDVQGGLVLVVAGAGIVV